MTALKNPYDGRVVFTVITAADKHAAEVKKFGIGNHGLVGIGATGEIKFKSPGHELGKRADGKFKQDSAIRKVIEKDIKSKLLNE